VKTSENPKQIVIRENGDHALAIINGKTFRLLRGYQYDDGANDAWLFLAVAGKTPLKADDLAENWRVIKSGDVYFAMRARAFSYHLIAGEDAEPPNNWPRLKAGPELYAFVGPTEDAAGAQFKLAMDEYAPGKEYRSALDNDAFWLDDLAGSDVRALAIRASDL
jgi:hypothetical protein